MVSEESVVDVEEDDGQVMQTKQSFRASLLHTLRQRFV